MTAGERPAARGHYETSDLIAAVLADIRSGAVVPGPALDQFHIGGPEATRRLAKKVDLPQDARVLDVGSGMGGPARLLARDMNWDVTGVDLTPGFCLLADAVSGVANMRARTRFCAADALQLPFADVIFDAVWTEHVAMNIPDRAALYGELRRVTRPGGALALFDVVAGDNPAPLDFPVPWSRGSAGSHLVTGSELMSVLKATGWAQVDWADESAFALDWLESARPPKSGDGPSLRSVMGEDFPVMIANLRANFSDGRLGAVQAVMKKAA